MDRLISECEIIYHLAAAVGVELIVRDPVRVIETNIKGCEAVLRIGARYRKKVMLASTSEVYGKNEALPFREDADCVIGATSRARWSYACSKAMDEFLALAYARQLALPVVIMRFFNTVGPRQTGRYGMVVPRFVQQALRGDAHHRLWRWAANALFHPRPGCYSGHGGPCPRAGSGGGDFQHRL